MPSIWNVTDYGEYNDWYPTRGEAFAAARRIIADYREQVAAGKASELPTIEVREGVLPQLNRANMCLLVTGAGFREYRTVAIWRDGKPVPVVE